MRNTMTIYGCGGTGVNVVTKYITKPQKDEPGYAHIQPYLIDTSSSNITTDKLNEAFYKIKLDKNVEGSGSVRAENVEEIRQQVPNFIIDKKPGNISLVVASANGGSGSTIAPVLMAELVKRGHPVIGLLFVDDNSLKSTENASRTLISFDTMAKKAGVPFVAIIVPNRSITNANEMAYGYIDYLAMLFSNENHGLDNADLKNFLNFTKVTSTQPGLASLMITDKLEEKYNRNPIALAMLHTSVTAQEAARGKFVTAYSCEGIYRLSSGKDIADKTIFFTVEFDDVLDTMKHLDNQISRYNEEINGVVNRSIKLKDESASVEDDGLVL